ncbi:OmpH family outer membrane protein [Sphingomicrobium nitratireducens]|uniref:OmpH family outer membrane protein n=1 Tax=Sphingomicrobium nitratireducens TaxID=2964666 RepID=UPI00223F2678|nr:OmpH family outer membrane protein [Sphingomicrobium nitratireducens]
MKTKMIAALVAATAMTLPAAAAAQALPAAAIGVVDTSRVSTDCTACKTAGAQLEAQAKAIRDREQQLATPLETEGKAIQAAVDALKGAQADQALQTRAQTFEQRRQAAAQEIQQRQQTFQRNRSYVAQQFAAALEPAVNAVMTRRGATIVMDAGTVMLHAPAVDITNDVLAEVNRTLTTLNTTAPAPAQPAQQQTPPAGR